MPDDITSPLVACDNAITHYESVLRNQMEYIEQQRRVVQHAEAELPAMNAKLLQWREAKAVLLQQNVDRYDA